MKILMVTPEMAPLAKTGGLADVAGALPPALAELGDEVAVVLPCYRGLEKKWRPERTGLEVSLQVPIEDRWLEKRGEVLRLRLADRVQVFLVKLDEYYDRDGLYVDPAAKLDYPDNCARFTFLCRAALELVRAGVVKPDVIHAHDWQAALAAIYPRTLYRDDPALAGVATAITIHNLAYKGEFWRWDMKLLGLDESYFDVKYLEYHGRLNLLKGAIVFADAVSTVSKGYAAEIRGPELGYGLEGVINDRANDLYGIVNGIDYDVWSPENDKLIPARFSSRDLSGKAKCKAALQKELSLPAQPRIPLLATISRLIDQKGFDLIAAIAPQLIETDLQLVLLGTGDQKYEACFTDLARKHPDRVAVKIGFDDGLAHRIEAGADLFLMPSRFEPCGLNQMISMKYGTIPLVRTTGGLADTVTPWDDITRSGVGFKFSDYDPEALWQTLAVALDLYGRKDEWRRLMRNAMSADHSWRASAEEYRKMYRRALERRRA